MKKILGVAVLGLSLVLAGVAGAGTHGTQKKDVKLDAKSKEFIKETAENNALEVDLARVAAVKQRMSRARAADVLPYIEMARCAGASRQPDLAPNASQALVETN